MTFDASVKDESMATRPGLERKLGGDQVDNVVRFKCNLRCIEKHLMDVSFFTSGTFRSHFALVRKVEDAADSSVSHLARCP